MAPSLFLLQASLFDSDTEHLIAAENSLPRGSILDMQDILKLNYFAADEGKCLIFRVFIKAGKIFFCVCAEFPIILLRVFSNYFLHDSLIQLFFHKGLLVQDANCLKW